MKHITEAILAVGAVLILGVGLWLYGGGELGDGTGSRDTAPDVAIDPEAVARGMELANNTGCLACHSVDGSPNTGPTWKGVAGSSRPLESGESVTADTAYLFNSIVDPAAQVVTGFAPSMPATYSESLTETEINDLVAYIQSLAG